MGLVLTPAAYAAGARQNSRIAPQKRRIRIRNDLKTRRPFYAICYDLIMPTPGHLHPDFAAVQNLDRHMEAKNRLIVALDVPDEKAALALVDRLEGTCSWVKVGLELFVASGP